MVKVWQYIQHVLLTLLEANHQGTKRGVLDPRPLSQILFNLDPSNKKDKTWIRIFNIFTSETVLQKDLQRSFGWKKKTPSWPVNLPNARPTGRIDAIGEG